MKHPSSRIVISVLLLIAVRLELNGAEAPPGASQPPTLGPDSAPVTLELFSDFQCPQCADVDLIVKKLQSESADKLRVVFRHFPMKKHQNATLAACAAEAAAKQGKFWKMGEALFRKQWMWATAPAPRVALIDRAREVGVNVIQFEEELERPEARQRIAADVSRGVALGVKATPSIFINGYFVPDPEMSENGFRSAIQRALAKSGQ